MLSNTAIPKYYGEFRDRVLNREIPVCETVSLEMNRIDELIRNPNFYYDDQAVEGWIEFCNNELTLVDGSDFHMLDTFKMWGEAIYGWYYFIRRSVYVPDKDGHGGHYVNKVIKKRLCNKQYLIVPRSNAKSMYAECHQAFGLIVDTSTTNQVVTAPTMRQAEETVSPLRTAIAKARGPVFRFLTEGSLQNTTGSRAFRQKLASTKKGIENFLTNSIIEIRPMRIDKLQGLRNKYSTVDEWLSGDISEDVIGALEQGGAKFDDWFIIATSSEGTVRNGPGDDIKIELMDILKGDYYNPHVSIWWYQLDDIKEVSNPELWIKANPNIGVTVTHEVIQIDVERAENNPIVRNDILAKRFDIPLEGFTYFFTYQETIPHKYREYWKLRCSMGVDLSQGDDFCAFTFLFPLSNGRFGIKTRSYISERTLLSLPSALRKKYDEFIEEGSVMVMPGAILDMMKVYDDLDQFIIDHDYDVCSVGYDPYNAKTFMERWGTENGEYGIEVVPQGAKTESVPLGEIKTMAEDRMLLFDEKLMSFSMGNCIVLKDSNNNKKLCKKKREQKIDNVSALLDAYVAFKANPEMYE